MKIDSAAACRFFSAEEACRWALAAYYGASRDVEPPSGVPFVDDGVQWSSPAYFGDAVLSRFAAALVAAAIDARIPCDHGNAAPSFSWDDSGFAGSMCDRGAALFLGPPLNDLPPANNAADNQAESGVCGG